MKLYKKGVEKVYTVYPSIDEEKSLLIIPSGTLDHYHVIIEDAYQEVSSYFLTKSQVEKKFAIKI